MVQYSVDFGRVQAVLGEIEGVDKQIRSMLDTLEANSERSLAEWQSDARLAYNDCKAKWDASAARMPELLRQARQALTEIMTNYNRAEGTGSDMWNSLGVGRR
ncbi:WXG100 family type VII secretion target [Streptoalloteichus hindustanus]|uniref:ESAT-6-like protein n=1 Tax=Streptoalloteichus hindustanus TaxID=2017 RepID=A0A1M5PVB7_STRHI|nr:WXG100 family type VII secretion target [Streptoalloteichus hindustanus]SHH05977.1 WXG100 family type VII secretion target [Streptoalloteichus hindustanus]